jgi:hypothetical protein
MYFCEKCFTRLRSSSWRQHSLRFFDETIALQFHELVEDNRGENRAEVVRAVASFVKRTAHKHLVAEQLQDRLRELDEALRHPHPLDSLLLFLKGNVFNRLSPNELDEAYDAEEQESPSARVGMEVYSPWKFKAAFSRHDTETDDSEEYEYVRDMAVTLKDGSDRERLAAIEWLESLRDDDKAAFNPVKVYQKGKAPVRLSAHLRKAFSFEAKCKTETNTESMAVAPLPPTQLPTLQTPKAERASSPSANAPSTGVRDAPM